MLWADFMWCQSETSWTYVDWQQAVALCCVNCQEGVALAYVTCQQAGALPCVCWKA